MQTTSIKLDLMPLQVADFGSPQPMTIGDQDHGGIAMTMPIALGGFDQSLNLALGEIAALDCEVFGVWGRSVRPGFHRSLPMV
jgi:hypothetical protein